MKSDGHRWIFLPIALALTLLGGILYMSHESFARLEAAAERVRIAEERQTQLTDYLLLVTEAETAQRSYLLTRKREYLVPFEKAAAELPGRIEWLLDDYERHGPASNVQQIQWLDGLTAGKLREIGESIDLYQSGGIRSAMALVRTEFGRKQMDEIREAVSGLQIEEGLAVGAAVDSWHRELWIGRALIIAATALAMLLVVVAALLVTRDVRRRREHARQLEEHNAELDAQVRSRTAALSNLSSELQRVSEREKRALARELHDELGSLLIAAKMDVSWLRKRLPADDADVALRWNRVLAGLDEGVDLKRRVVEHLRPTLLDNLGLVPAIKWVLEESCGRAGMRCIERYPADDLRLTDDASIAVFRVVQESLTNIVRHSGARTVDLAVELSGGDLVVRIRDDGKGIAPDRMSNVVGSHGIASMRHRVTSLGGQWKIQNPPEGGTLIIVRLPLSSVLLKDEAAA
jgi:signal transduction histidine kinase